MQLTLSLTHNCTLVCSYCYAGQKRPVAMSYETACRGLDLSLAQKPEKIELGFFGGEPLMEWELLQRSSLYAHKLAETAGVSLTKNITTNGTLLTDSRMQWLSEHGFFVALSLDGNRQMHDRCRNFANGEPSFDECFAGLATALSFDPLARVIIVCTPANIDCLSESINFLYNEAGVIRIALNPDFYAVWNEAALATWKKELKKSAAIYMNLYRTGRSVALSSIDNKIFARLKEGLTCEDHCRFGDEEFAIAPSGRIYPCERLIGDDNNDALCIGSVQSGFNRLKQLDIVSKRGSKNPECESCSLNPICQRSCGCVNYMLTGHTDRTDGIVCFHERMTAEIANRAASVLFNEGNPAFLERFYDEKGEHGS